jgi:hypothetical protein
MIEFKLLKQKKELLGVKKMKRILLTEVLKGKRIILKRVKVEMAEKIYISVAKERERLRYFLPWANHINSLNDEINYLKSAEQDWESSIEFNYCIYEQHSEEYLGNIGVHSIQWENSNAELGYWILKDFEGCGYISEAVSVLDSHLFEKGFHRVRIRCSDLNQKSSKVPRRCNYTFEGVSREDIYEQSRFRSSLNFSKLKTDVI